MSLIPRLREGDRLVLATHNAGKLKEFQELFEPFGLELTSAGELGLPYTVICVVDNLANGVADRPLTVEEFEAGKLENRSRLTSAIGAVAAVLGGEDRA